MLSDIDKYCTELAESIISESFLDKNDLILKIAVHFKMAYEAIYDKELEQKIAEKNKIWRTKEFALNRGRDSQLLQDKLTILNSEIKEINRKKRLLQDYDEYSKLKAFVNIKFGKEAMAEFYESLKK